MNNATITEPSQNRGLAPGQPARKLGKNEQIIEGCKRLAAKQEEGQCFTPSEIGRACGVHKRSIVFIERKAMLNFAKKLHASCPGLLEEVLRDRPIKEVFATLSVDPYRTGREAKRPKLEKRKDARLNVRPGTMKMREVTLRARAVA